MLSKSAHRCDLCAWQRDQERNTSKETCSPRPPTASDRNYILRGGWSLRGSVLSFEFHQNRLSGLRDVGVKFALFHCIGHWLIQQLVVPYTSRDNNSCIMLIYILQCGGACVTLSILLHLSHMHNRCWRLVTHCVLCQYSVAVSAPSCCSLHTSCWRLGDSSSNLSRLAQ